MPIHGMTKGEIAMNKNEREGKMDQVKGKVKEGVGHVTDDPNMKDEGQMDQTKGKVQEGVGKVQREVGERMENAGKNLQR
ncbi:MAG: CsbD family protein [Vicinamibacterales bacterium]|jgi:uncharacterized protein YjbJ (UPF0337 family)